MLSYLKFFIYFIIFYRGLPPYIEFSNSDVIDHLRSGSRLKKTECCPDLMFELMNMCWEWSPQDRPCFTQIIKEIKDRAAFIQQTKYDTTVTRSYVNVSSGKCYNPDQDVKQEMTVDSNSSGFVSGESMTFGEERTKYTTIVNHE